MWLPQQTRSADANKGQGRQRPYQLYVSQLLGQSVRVAADGNDVPLYGLRFGLQNREPICRCGADFRQDFLILAECGKFADKTLDHLLDVLPVCLPGNKQRITSLSCTSVFTTVQTQSLCTSLDVGEPPGQLQEGSA